MRPIGPGAAATGIASGSVADRRHEVEVLEDAGEQRLGGLQVERDAHEPHERHEQPRLHRRERDDRAGGDRVGAARDEVARHEVDHGRDARHQHLDDREEALAAHRAAHLQPDLVAVLVLVARGLGALPVERLRQQDARDAQRLLRDRGELRQRLLRLAGDPRAHLADAPLHDHEERHHHDGDQRQPPVDQDHRDERGDHRHEVAEDARDGVREHARDAADVVLQAGLDDAGLGPREESELHRLQVLEELHPQVAGDLVADRRGELGLDDAERRRQQEQPDHDRDEPPEQRDVGCPAVDREQRVVEDALHDQRRDDGDRGAGDDEEAGDEDPPQVRAEQRDDPAAEVGDLRGLRVELLLRGDVDAAEAGVRRRRPARRLALPCSCGKPNQRRTSRPPASLRAQPRPSRG